MLRGLFGKQRPSPFPQVLRQGNFSRVQEELTDFLESYDEYHQSEQFFNRLDWSFFGLGVAGMALGAYVGRKDNEDFEEGKKLGTIIGFGHGALGGLFPPLGIYFSYLYCKYPDYFKCERETDPVTGKIDAAWSFSNAARERQ